MDWTTILLGLAGLSFVADIITHVVLDYKKRINNANADKEEAEANIKEWELEEKRIKNLHDSIEHNNETINKLTTLIDSLTERLSTQNKAIDKHIDRNRELSDRLYASETEVNRVNQELSEAKEEIIRLTKQLAEEKARKEYFKRWRCEKSICNDPDGRRPPNNKLMSEKFVDPEKKK